LTARKDALSARTDDEVDAAELELHPDGLKVCSACGDVLPVDDFYRDRRQRDGRDYSCRDCRLDARERAEHG